MAELGGVRGIWLDSTLACGYPWGETSRAIAQPLVPPGLLKLLIKPLFSILQRPHFGTEAEIMAVPSLLQPTPERAEGRHAGLARLDANLIGPLAHQMANCLFALALFHKRLIDLVIA